MKFSMIEIKRRLSGLFHKAESPARHHVPVTGLEPLEQRVLLSAVGLVDLTEPIHRIDIDGATYKIDLPGWTSSHTASTASGVVFRDTDADGWQDPAEHALKRVTVFADVDGDGRLGVGEASVVTDGYGKFRLTGLPEGTYDVRVLMPDGYKAEGAEYASVMISSSRGEGALELGIAPTGFDLGVQLSDVSMPDTFKTGTRVKIPVLVTNRGDTFMPAGDTTLRLHLSGNKSLSDDDIRLTKTALDRGLKPGESVKIELEVTLADALADFSSYLILDAVGRSLRSEMDRGNNEDITDSSLWFETSSKQPTLGDGIVGVVKQNWVVVAPYGGYTPGYGYGDGFVGISDLNVVLGNWNAGTPPQPPSNINTDPVVGSVKIAGGSLIHGQATRITAEGVYDPDGTVQRVWFFYDSDNDRVIDEVLGVDTDGSDGYSVLANMSAERRLSSDGRVIAVAMDNGYELGGATVNTSPSLGVTVSAGKQLVYRESDGTLVEVSLAGRGGALVLLRGNGIRAWDLGETIEITGSATIGDILLKRTTGRSKLHIKTTGAGSSGRGAAVTGKITGSTPLGLLSANGVDLVGGIEMTGRGAIRTIKANSIRSIEMPGETFGNGVSITAGKITGEVRLGSTLRLLDVGDLIDTRVTTPSADRVLVKRDFKRSRLILTDNDAALSLGLLQVGKRMQSVMVHASSSIDTIRAKSMVKSHVLIGGSSWVSAPASLAGVGVKSGKINSLTVGGGVFAESYVVAWRIGRVSLNRVGADTASGLNGLYYRRLDRYDGPDSLDRTVV